MGYDLYPNNEEMQPFHMGGAWSHLLEQSGAYFTCIYNGPKWYMLRDERMTAHHHDDNANKITIDTDYPAIICNCGFEITEEEAKVLARIARNYATIQHAKQDEDKNRPIATPDYLRPFHLSIGTEWTEIHDFPQPIRHDWIETYEAFAEWAEQSQGFRVF